MDPAEDAGTAVPDAPVGEASEAPLILEIMLWVPVFAVVLWFMVRLFSGRWITDPAPDVVPPPDGPPPDDPHVERLRDDVR